MTDVVDLTRELVQIASYVDDSTNEDGVARLLREILETHPSLTVTLEPIGKNGRCNVVARTKGPPSLLLAGHMDTVREGSGWMYGALAASIVDDRMYGLGALDMKGGIAAITSSVMNCQALPDGLILLFYCDEEYYFAGMRAFLEQPTERPRLAVIAEPTDGRIWDAHRGVVELVVRLTGRSAHASRPWQGVNAIRVAARMIQELEEFLAVRPNEVLGTSTVNVAGLIGGLKSPDGHIITQANAVADHAIFTLDIRPSAPEFTASSLAEWLRQRAEEKGCEIRIAAQLDLGSLSGDRSKLAALENAIRSSRGAVSFADATTKGYGDAQLIKEAWDIPVANFGPTGERMHSPNEWVSIRSLIFTETVYGNLLREFQGGAATPSTTSPLDAGSAEAWIGPPNA